MRRKIQRLTSMILLLLFILNMLPSSILIVYGSTLPKVTIQNIYKDFKVVEKNIIIEDKQIEDWVSEDRNILLEVNKVWEDASNIKNIGTRRIQAQLDPTWNVSSVILSGIHSDNQKPQEKTYGKIDGGMLSIEYIENPSIGIDEEIIAVGSEKLQGIVNNPEYSIDVGSVGAKAIKGENDKQIKIVPKNEFDTFNSGALQDIIITRSQEISQGNDGNYNLENTFVYREAITIIGSLELDGITMFPTAGEPRSTITFTRSSFPEKAFDVYFIKDLNNLSLYTEKNKATNFQYNPLAAGTEKVITVNVPDIETGTYHIVFTNADSQKSGIDKRYVLDQQFTIIGVSAKPSIEGVTPNGASAWKGKDITISGNLFTKIDISGLSLNNTTINEVKNTDGTLKHLDYGKGYMTLTGNDDDKFEVEVTREFQVDIGRPLKIKDFKFEEGSESDPNTFSLTTDVVEVREETKVDVVINIITTITPKTSGKPITVAQRVVRSNGFTYYPSTESPEVTEVSPSVIPLEQQNYLDNSMDELLLTIKGSNFLVTLYTSDGTEKLRYPKVSMGGVTIDPNLEGEPGMQGDSYKPISFEVMKGNNTIDGRSGNEIGDRIDIKLKAGNAGLQIKNQDSRDVKINNPIRESTDFQQGFYGGEEMVRFSNKVVDRDPPIIEDVDYKIVSLDGQDRVVITGSKFKPDVEVHIDNEPVKIIERTEDGQTLIVNMPPGRRAGKSQLRITNPLAGIATYDIIYIPTYTQAEISLINPKKGTTGTLVNIKGKNFSPIDPTVKINNINNIDELVMYQLIGSRVLMDGKDINQYHDGSNRPPKKLIPFTEEENRNIKDDIFVVEGDEIQLGDSFDSILLYEESSERFYKIIRNVLEEYIIEHDSSIRYTVKYEDGKIKATMGSNTYEINQSTKGTLEFKSTIGNTYTTLKAYTPFLIERKGGYDKIIGNRVEYVDGSTLLFEVPNADKLPWTGAGLYDITVVSPDTREVTLDKAFQYKPAPQTIPEVIDMTREEGPEAGGNKLRIFAPDKQYTGFVDINNEKTKVFIGSQEVPSNQVIVSQDKKEITLTVPKYNESIREKGTNSIMVPVILVNPDGGSFHIWYNKPIEVEREDFKEEPYTKLLRGYTYLIPASEPKIFSIQDKDASIDGGKIVSIIGRDFRNFIIDQNGKRIYASDKKRDSIYDPELKDVVFASPLYPTIYFGDKQAEIISFESYNDEDPSGYMMKIEVIVPPGEGKVDVHLMNYDYGISEKVDFDYKTSVPKITSITPNSGNRREKIPVTIKGTDLREGNITLLKVDYDENENSIREILRMAAVKVGDRDNRNIYGNNENSGIISSAKDVEITLDGGVTIRQPAKTDTLEVSIMYKNKIYNHVYKGLPKDAFYINTKDLKNGDDNYPYEELIKVYTETKDFLKYLKVEGGYAPEAKDKNGNQLEVTMPYYHTAAKVKVEVVNPDGIRAEYRYKFEYTSPDSNPIIDNIIKEENEEPIEEYREEYGKIRVLKLHYRAMENITVIGKDFRKDATITIIPHGEGRTIEIPAKDITHFPDEAIATQLSFMMPVPMEGEGAVGKLYKVIVSNKDKAHAYSDKLVPPIYIEFIKGESDPELGSITPDKGLATDKGSTRVKITGDDFRSKMEGFEEEVLKVFFRTPPGRPSKVYTVSHEVGKEDEKIKIENYATLYVTIPKVDEPGVMDVVVKNPDGTPATPPLKFTYISKPEIEKVDPAKIFTNDTQTEITITGKMFMPGAKAVLGGEVKGEGEIKSGDIVRGTGIYEVQDGNNIEKSVIGGVLATSVTVESSEVIKVKFPEAFDLKSSSLIIINPDGGISDPYEDFDYKLPVPTKPLVLEAIPGYESTVQLVWSDSSPEVLNAADKYEVYGKLSSEKNYSFIGDTKEAEFLIKGLEVNTRYDFMVRALNRYGSALEFAEVSTRTLTLKEDDKLKDKQEELDKAADKLRKEGREEIVDGALVKTIGTEQISSGGGLYTLDFSLSQYKGQDKFIVALPVSILTTLNRNIMITDGKANFTFNPRNLYTREVIERARANSEDAHVRVTFERVTGQEATELQTAIPRTKHRASGIYGVDFQLQVEKNITALRQMLQPGSLAINFDSRSYPNANRDKIFIGKYDVSKHEFVKTGSGNYSSTQEPARFILLSDR